MSDKRSFIEWTQVDTKPVVTQLTRIADALEVIILLQYGIRLSESKPLSTTNEDESIDYASTDETLKQELQEAIRGKGEDES